MPVNTPARPAHAPDRWRSHGVLALVVRTLVLVAPVLAAVVAAIIVAQLLPVPADGLPTLLWLAAVVAVAVAAYLGVERCARALLPLAVLLKLSLLFPDRAPSRLRMVWHVGSGRHLAELTTAARVAGRNDDRTRTAELLVSMIAALGRHDPRTRGHSERVRAYTDLITCELRLPEADRDRIRWAALVHDLGKLVVPTTLLNKPGSPDPTEWETLRRHPAEGARLAAALLPWLGEWGRAVDEHHERWDGSGYPHGLAGVQIARGARIVAVADAFEVMTAVRAYKKAISAPDARAELVRCAGSQFDPVAVRALMSVSLGRLRWVMGPAAYVVALPFVSVLRTSGPRLRHASGVAAALLILGALGVLTSSPGSLATLRHPPGKLRAAGAVPAGNAGAAATGPEATVTAGAGGGGPTSVLGLKVTAPASGAPTGVPGAAVNGQSVGLPGATPVGGPSGVLATLGAPAPAPAPGAPAPAAPAPGAVAPAPGTLAPVAPSPVVVPPVPVPAPVAPGPPGTPPLPVIPPPVIPPPVIPPPSTGCVGMVTRDAHRNLANSNPTPTPVRICKFG